MNTQAEALRASYTSLQDDIRRFEHAVREEIVQTGNITKRHNAPCGTISHVFYRSFVVFLEVILVQHPQLIVSSLHGSIEGSFALTGARVCFFGPQHI